MLLVKTTTGPSSIHGKGVFAAEFIPAGTEVWKFIQDKDKSYTKEEVQKLAEPGRSEILSLFHSYISKQTGRYVTLGDYSGNINHSIQPNLGVRYEKGVEEDINFALRDIQPDEELTLDYREFAQEGVDFKS